MTIDYDLVIIGGSAAGIHAAVEAAHLRARVALVEQGITVANSAPTSPVLVEVGRSLQQLWQAEQLGLWQSQASLQPDWNQIQTWAKEVNLALEETHSPAVLSSQGIEVIPGTGEFCRKPKLGFTIQGRLLRSRTYLLAPRCRPIIPAIDGLELTGYCTTETVMQQPDFLPRVKSLVIIGGDPIAATLAQTFAQCGLQVTLIVSEALILPTADPEMAYLIQAQLEAEGIQVLTRTQVSQVRQIQGQKWVQAGNQAIAADEILLAMGVQPDLESLNLDAARVRWNAEEIPVNVKLQTTNHQIYACTGQIDRSYANSVACYEARIALKNALFFPKNKATQRYLPRVVKTSPELAWVGLTEPQAIQQYGKDVTVLRQTLDSNTQAQVSGKTTGLGKLIVRQNGEILGAHLVSPTTSEAIGTIALAMQHKLPVQTLANLPFPDLTFAEVIRQTAAEWHHQRLAQNHRLQDFLEGFFSFRRLWF